MCIYICQNFEVETHLVWAEASRRTRGSLERTPPPPPAHTQRLFEHSKFSTQRKGGGGWFLLAR